MSFLPFLRNTQISPIRKSAVLVLFKKAAEIGRCPLFPKRWKNYYEAGCCCLGKGKGKEAGVGKG